MNDKMIRIDIKNLSKKFIIDTKKGFLSRIKFHFSKNKNYKIAINDLTLKINSSEVVGIIGNNGAGKTTLLKTIARILVTNKGKIITRGKIAFINNIGMAIRDQLTMRENIYLLGSFLNMNKKEIEENMNKILEFSGIEKFLDTKVYQFSNGMRIRLAFSIGVYSNADIILIDEVSEGSDIEFLNRLILEAPNFIKNKGSLILAGHNIDFLLRLCQRVIWLKDGKIVMEGDPKKVVFEYKKYYKVMK